VNLQRDAIAAHRLIAPNLLIGVDVDYQTCRCHPRDKGIRPALVSKRSSDLIQQNRILDVSRLRRGDKFEGKDPAEHEVGFRRKTPRRVIAKHGDR